MAFSAANDIDGAPARTPRARRLDMGLSNETDGAQAPEASQGVLRQAATATEARFRGAPDLRAQALIAGANPPEKIMVVLDPETNAPNMIPFVAVPSFDDGRFYRWQLPLNVAPSRAVHKSQGFTAHNGLDLRPTDVAQDRDPFAPSLEYVRLSRPPARWRSPNATSRRSHIAQPASTAYGRDDLDSGAE